MKKPTRLMTSQSPAVAEFQDWNSQFLPQNFF